MTCTFPLNRNTGRPIYHSLHRRLNPSTRSLPPTVRSWLRAQRSEHGAEGGEVGSRGRGRNERGRAPLVARYQLSNRVCRRKVGFARLVHRLGVACDLGFRSRHSLTHRRNYVRLSQGFLRREPICRVDGRPSDGHPCPDRSGLYRPRLATARRHAPVRSLFPRRCKSHRGASRPGPPPDRERPVRPQASATGSSVRPHTRAHDCSLRTGLSGPAFAPRRLHAPLTALHQPPATPRPSARQPRVFGRFQIVRRVRGDVTGEFQVGFEHPDSTEALAQPLCRSDCIVIACGATAIAPSCLSIPG
ncbi:hypothetical protein Hhis01_02676 [Haloarcula hispanica]